MYLWKCWRDTRWYLLVFLAIAATAMPLSAFASHGGTAMLDAGSLALRGWFVMIVTAVAYALGTLCAIQEFTDKTAHFLFTKPRSRSYFVWVSWLVGLTELVLVVVVTFSVGWLVLRHYGVSAFSSNPVAIVSRRDYLEAIVYACFAYALTFALAVICRNGLKGLGASLGLMAGYVGVVDLFLIRWHIMLPIPPRPLWQLSLEMSSVIWLFVALGFVLLAQTVVDRAEI
jgi:hypothetical protein